MLVKRLLDVFFMIAERELIIAVFGVIIKISLRFRFVNVIISLIFTTICIVQACFLSMIMFDPLISLFFIMLVFILK